MRHEYRNKLHRVVDDNLSENPSNKAMYARQQGLVQNSAHKCDKETQIAPINDSPAIRWHFEFRNIVYVYIRPSRFFSRTSVRAPGL